MEWMRRTAPVIFLVVAVTFVGGFLLAETSGLLGTSSVTPTTAVATVNGDDVLATRWFTATQQMEQQESQAGRPLSLDDRERLADRAFEDLVARTLLLQEYERRGIRATDDEIRSAALHSPPPDFMASPELQTEGRFDPAKYQRLLNSPAARQQGLNLQLEGYYREEIPKRKLFDQIASDVYVSDVQLWSFWQARHDSAQIAYIRFDPDTVSGTVSVTDEEIRRYYDTHKKNIERPTRALVSVMVIPRIVGATDSAASRARVLALREEITRGARSFEDVARTESADSGSAVRGGDLGPGVRGRFVPAFEQAAYSLPLHEVSQPVLTPFGYHLIRVDERNGDSLSAHHVLVRITQSESAAAATDRRADSLSRITGAADDPRKFDEASRTLGIPISRAVVLEGQTFTIAGRYVPSVSAWAVTSARPADVSDLFDWDEGYAIARLDSLYPGGIPALEAVKSELRTLLARLKKLDQLVAEAQPVARDAARTSMAAAAARSNHTAQQSGWITRTSPAAGVGRLNEAIGAAFTLPIGAVSAPLRTLDGVFIIQVLRRTLADRQEFERQKTAIRADEIGALRQQRIQQFLGNLRDNAKVVDRRKQIAAAQRRVVQ